MHIQISMTIKTLRIIRSTTIFTKTFQILCKNELFIINNKECLIPNESKKSNQTVSHNTIIHFVHVCANRQKFQTNAVVQPVIGLLRFDFHVTIFRCFIKLLLCQSAFFMNWYASTVCDEQRYKTQGLCTRMHALFSPFQIMRHL